MNLKLKIAQIVIKAIDKAYPDKQYDISLSDMVSYIESPPDEKMGDFAFPCFKLGRYLRQAPSQIASSLKEEMQSQFIENTEVVGGYLNIYLDRKQLAKITLENVLSSGDKWGKIDEGRGKTICIDYSSVNIAKRFHIGHISSTMIGHSLKRIYDYLGYETVGINHLGDWGSQFGKMIAAFKHWGDKDTIQKEGVKALGELYVKFHDEAKKNPELEDEGRMWFKAIEDGNEEALSIFEWFKRITLKDANSIYETLGVSFDSYAGESFYNDKIEPIINRLKEKNLLTISDGAAIVQLEEFDMPPCLILRKDGATLYATRDLAAAVYRHEKYNFEKNLYVVAYEQDLHFRQIFKVLELMGYSWAKDLIHVSFGMVSYEGQKLSSREGHMVYLEDVLSGAVDKAEKIIEEKNPNLINKGQVAKQVGVGAVVYAVLQNTRIKDIDFWWERMLSFDGETGPYVQYAHARCCSLLDNANAMDLPAPDYSLLVEDEAKRLILELADFPQAIKSAAERFEPYILTRAITNIAQAYNKFYFEHRILLEEEPKLSSARVALTRAVRDTIKRGLFLIGLEAPKKM